MCEGTRDPFTRVGRCVYYPGRGHVSPRGGVLKSVEVGRGVRGYRWTDDCTGGSEKEEGSVVSRLCPVEAGTVVR